MSLRRLFAAFVLAVAPALAAAQTARPLSSGLAASNSDATIRVTALTDTILRVRIAPTGKFPEDASWAVSREVRRKSVPVHARRDGFTTNAVAIHVDPATLALRLTDLQGKTIVADLPDAVHFDGRGFHLRK